MRALLFAYAISMLSSSAPNSRRDNVLQLPTKNFAKKTKLYAFAMQDAAENRAHHFVLSTTRPTQTDRQNSTNSAGPGGSGGQDCRGKKLKSLSQTYIYRFCAINRRTTRTSAAASPGLQLAIRLHGVIRGGMAGDESTPNELLDVRTVSRLDSDHETSGFGAKEELVCDRSTGSAKYATKPGGLAGAKNTTERIAHE